MFRLISMSTLCASLLFVGCGDETTLNAAGTGATGGTGGSGGTGAMVGMNIPPSPDQGLGGIAGEGGSAETDAGGAAGMGGEGGSGGSGGSGGRGGAGGAECQTTESYFERQVWPAFDGTCTACHTAQGIASETRMVLVPGQSLEALMNNLEAVRAVSEITVDGEALILLKPTGLLPHAGGTLIDIDSPEHQALVELTQRIRGDLDECGEPTGEQPPPMGNECDQPTPGRRMVRRLSHTEYSNTIYDLIGVEFDAHGAFVADTVDHGFDNHPEHLEITPLLMTQYQQASETLMEAMDPAAVLPCDLAEADMACGHRFIAEFGLRAFRRPLTSEEIAAYRTLFGMVVEQECFEQAVRWVTAAMLQSPHFLYRTELGTQVEGEFVLTPYEIASELSYMFWQTMPDDTLFELAHDGQLLEREVIAAQVERLLASPRSARMMFDFAERWLDIRRLLTVVRDSEIYMALYFELREAMLRESWFFLEELWTADRPLEALFTSQHSWLNQELSEYYGIPLGAAPQNEDGFARVAVNETRPGGILTHGSFLTTHASPTSSSPIHRGVIVRERVLCEELPPPPEGLDVEPPEFDPDLTTRERFAAHTDSPECFGCHRLIDHLGFGFEGYDGIGRYRAEEGGHPVDTSGTLVQRRGDDLEFDGVGELTQNLAGSEQVQRCYIRQWLRFSIGETEGVDTECYLDALTEGIGADGTQMTSPLRGLTRLPHFVRRSGELDEGDVPGAELTTSVPGVPVEVDDPAIPPADLQNVACGAPPVPSDGPQFGAPGLMVESREDRWQTGYCAYYTVRNTTDAPLEWAIRIQVEGEINNAWNCQLSAMMGLVEVTGAGWNNSIPPMQQVDFGFCADL